MYNTFGTEGVESYLNKNQFAYRTGGSCTNALQYADDTTLILDGTEESVTDRSIWEHIWPKAEQ